MNEFEPYVPSKRVIDHCEFVLSNTDEDIANTFREYGHGTYKPDSPLFIQLLRNLKALTDVLRINRVININNSGSGNDKSSDD
jgi:hypothetical protein